MANNTPTEKCTFFNDEKLSDVVIKFGDQQVFAHKVMLASGSVWFKKAFCGDLSVLFVFKLELLSHVADRTQEANKKVIELHDDDVSSEAIMAMLRHLYGLRYENQEFDFESWHLPGLHLAVFMLGDKYDIESLRDEAAELFEDYLESEVEDDALHEGTIHAIQKLVGPDDHQLADQSLTTSTRAFVLVHFEALFEDDTFRELMASGTMLDKGLSHEFLNKIYKKQIEKKRRR